jgi:cell division protein FtsB
MSERLIRFLIFIQIVVIFYLGFLVIKEKIKNKPFKEEFKIYKNYIEKLEKENKDLREKLEYLSDPENIKKEMKEKFNLVEPGEKVIILPENF